MSMRDKPRWDKNSSGIFGEMQKQVFRKTKISAPNVCFEKNIDIIFHLSDNRVVQINVGFCAADGPMIQWSEKGAVYLLCYVCCDHV